MNLRKINRGIALGCVVAVATTGYVVLDRKQFSKNTDAITAVVESYLNDTAATRCSAQDQKQLCLNYKNTIEKHWADNTWSGNNIFDDTATKEELLSELDTNNADYKTQGYFTKYEIKINDVKVSKYGSGALANVTYNVVDEFYGAPLDMITCGFEPVDNENTDANNNPITDPTIQYHQTSALDFNLYLEKVDDDWKIVGLSSNSYEYNTKRISEDASSKEDSSSADDPAQKGGADSE